METLYDQSYDVSATSIAHDVVRIGEKEDGLFDIEWDVTFSFGFLTHTERMLWMNEDVETLLEQLGRLKEQGTLGTLSPGLSIAYEAYPHEEGLYRFAFWLDPGEMNSLIGTEAGFGLALLATQEALVEWLRGLLPE